MEKVVKRNFVLVSFSLMLFLSLSLVSAGFLSDFFTGKATEGSFTLKSITVSEGNKASLSCDSGGLIASANATYWCPDGSGRQRNCNVAGAIGLSSYSYAFTNTNCGGDPCTYVKKEGNLSITCEGVNDTPPSLNCSDSDGGKNYYVSGFTSGNLSSGQSTNLSDGCIVSNDLQGNSALHDGWLREAFCGGDGYATFTDYECPHGCFNGACNISSSNEDVPSVTSSITIKGRLVDQLTGTPVAGARLLSAYEFSPSDVVTDESGNFEFYIYNDFKIKEGPEAGKNDTGGQWTFFKDCYGWSGHIVLQKDYELWEDGQLQRKYDFVLIKEKFDSKPSVIDISGKNEIEIGNVYAYPRADASIQSDLNASFNVMYKYKNSEGYNGGGNSNFRNKHYSSDALPLDYEVYIQFEDASGEEYDSSTYTVPSTLTCGVVSLKYFNGKSEWSSASSEQEFPDTPDTDNLPKEYYDRIIAEDIGRWDLDEGQNGFGKEDGRAGYSALYHSSREGNFEGDYLVGAIVIEGSSKRDIRDFVSDIWIEGNQDSREEWFRFLDSGDGAFLVNMVDGDPFISWTNENFLVILMIEDAPSHWKDLYRENNFEGRLELVGELINDVGVAYLDKYPSDLDPSDFEDEGIPVACEACELDNRCVPVGYRTQGTYCGLDGVFVDQNLENAICENNFECGSNFCVSGQCVDAGLMQRIINWFKNLFG